MGSFSGTTFTNDRLRFLGGKGASPLKKDLLRSKVLSNYWYVHTYSLLTQTSLNIINLLAETSMPSTIF